MLAGVNDTPERARELAELLDPKVFKVNLIPYNPTGIVRRARRATAIAAFKHVLDRARDPGDGAAHPRPRHRRRVRPARRKPPQLIVAVRQRPSPGSAHADGRTQTCADQPADDVADQQDETDQFAFTAVAAALRVLVRPRASRARNPPSDNGNSDADQRLKQKPRPTPREERRYDRGSQEGAAAQREDENRRLTTRHSTRHL